MMVGMQTLKKLIPVLFFNGDGDISFAVIVFMVGLAATCGVFKGRKR